MIHLRVQFIDVFRLVAYQTLYPWSFFQPSLCIVICLQQKSHIHQRNCRLSS
ncbi:unnamed protein product [Musa acuminata subsp. malaccensis]|uniref:(wild Malaysian banana) hypothetical protein n=1 Tax=Musa acuminata subsp. malaccensis TaxID=214687 RepID=A0A804JQU4_MUSAM|nr:unnamed protein product [Musa acuminata subsp. malaccensis]